jgi:hypothetical protein
MHGLVLDGLDIASDLGGLVLVLETEGLVLDNLLLLAGQLLWWHGGISLCVSSGWRDVKCTEGNVNAPQDECKGLGRVQSEEWF